MLIYLAISKQYEPLLLLPIDFGIILIIPASAPLISMFMVGNLFRQNKINPLLGATGVSAVPMAARVVHKVGQEADKKNYLLMDAMKMKMTVYIPCDGIVAKISAEEGEDVEEDDVLLIVE